MTVAEAFRGQNLPDDDDRGALDGRGQHLCGDGAQGAAQHDLAGPAGVGDDGRGAVGPVARHQFGDDLLDPLDGEVQHQRRPGRAEASQVLTRRHGRGPVRDPGQDDRLADAGHGELAAQGRGGRGERRNARGDVVADAGPVQAAGLLGDGAEDGRVTGAEAHHVQPRGVRLHHGRGYLVEGEVGGVDQPGGRRAVGEDLFGNQASGVQAHRAFRQQPLRPDGDQVCGARPGTDEVDGHGCSLRTDH
jgi:hypothetical protein